MKRFQLGQVGPAGEKGSKGDMGPLGIFIYDPTVNFAKKIKNCFQFDKK